jgi:NIPSNAP
MIYELRTYTLATGTTGKYLQLSRDVGREIRGDRYGKLEGAWASEFATAGQYVHLWSYADLNERARLSEELSLNERWRNEYIAQVRPLQQAQVNKILRPVDGIPFASPGAGKHVYELRTYQLFVGRASEWLAAFKEVLPVRQTYSPLVGMWTTDIGPLNQIVHLWAYDDLNHRTEARARAAEDPAWQAFLAKVVSLVQVPHSTILYPAPTSPLQ